ncbi:hypothetical protein FACS1894120_6050 [Clostridia bacterium]|nr:hypothetical protein FACS1894120_6050 [Clostridia bacterium]
MSKSIFKPIIAALTFTVGMVVFSLCVSAATYSVYVESTGATAALQNALILDQGAEGLYPRYNSAAPVDDDFTSRILFYSINGGKVPAGADAKEGAFTANKFVKYTEFKKGVLDKLFDSGGELVLIMSVDPIAAETSYSNLRYIYFPKIGARPAAPSIAANFLLDDGGEAPANLPRVSVGDPAYKKNFYAKQPLFFAVEKGNEGKSVDTTGNYLTPDGIEYAELKGAQSENDLKKSDYRTLTSSNNGFPINTVYSDINQKTATLAEDKKTFIFRKKAELGDTYASPAILPHAAGKTLKLSPTLGKEPTLKIDYNKPTEGIAISALKDSVLYLGNGTNLGTLEVGDKDTLAVAATAYDIGQSASKGSISFTRLLNGIAGDGLNSYRVGIFKKGTDKAPRSELEWVTLTLLPRKDRPVGADVKPAVAEAEFVGLSDDVNDPDYRVYDSVDYKWNPNIKWGKAMPACPQYSVRGMRFAMRFTANATNAMSLPIYFKMDNVKDTVTGKYDWNWGTNASSASGGAYGVTTN